LDHLVDSESVRALEAGSKKIVELREAVFLFEQLSEDANDE
jgi:hypothetical protein